jgi:RHS repeat-associated protein
MPPTGTTTGTLTLNGNMVFTLTWQPANGNLSANPAPAQVNVCYRRKSQVSANVNSPAGGVATASASGGVGSQNPSISASTPPDGMWNNSSPPQVDPSFIVESLSVSGTTATKSFTLTASFSAGADPTSDAGDSGTFGVDFCLVGYDLGRFGNPLHGLSNNHSGGGSDPTLTRWLPLAFSPQITSQPFRFQPGPLPTPWGNLNCMYSPTLQLQPNPPDYDSDGQALLYMPTLGSNGTFNNGLGPFQTLAGSLIPNYVITDANGDRLLFASNGTNYTAFENVHSTLSVTGTNTWTLSGAGPPGAMREAGHYTYTFHNFGSPQLFTAQLTQINDLAGNIQYLDWGANDYPVGPLLTVSDTSSGRALVFKANTAGYVGSVIAPEIGGGNHTVTNLTWDANGHATAINVYKADGQTLLHQDVFAYGGPNADSITTQQQGVSTSTFTYTSDTLVPGLFSLPIPRLSSATYGLSSDTTSSDDGGPVAGTYQYTFGPTQQGYNHYGAAPRTTTTTDPRTNVFKTTWSFAGGGSGGITRLDFTAPNFTGAAPNTNNAAAVYTGDIAQPSALTYYDPNTFLNQTTPWQSDYDGFGNLLQFTNPLSNSWKFGYSTDGTLLEWGTDPNNVAFQLTYGQNGTPLDHLTTVEDAVGCMTRLNYNTFGQPSNIWRAAAYTASGKTESTQFTYDPNTGDLTQTTAPNGDVLTLGPHDALGDLQGAVGYPDTGNPATSTTPLTTSVVYDASQMPMQITGPTGTSLVPSYNNGVTMGFSVVNGGVTQAQTNLLRDSRGRVYSVSDLLGSLIGYRYDRNSNPTRIIDGNGVATKQTYGANNEFTGTIWPDNTTTLALYDAGGRLVNFEDERGILTQFGFDAANELTSVQFPSAGSQNVTYGYDMGGRVTSVTDASGSRTYSYYAQSPLLKSVTTVLSGLPTGSNSFTLTYTYYPDGKLETLISPAGTTTCQYDVNGRMTSLTWPSGDTTSWLYDHVGRFTQQQTQSPTGVKVTTNTYWGVSGLSGDPSTAPAYLHQISETATKTGSTTWKSSYTLKHSVLGQLVSETGSTTAPNDTSSELFTYDTRGRLATESESYHPSSSQSFTNNATEGYDLANNLLAGVSGGWTYNNLNEVTSAPTYSGAPNLAGATGLSYDASGDLTGMNGRTLGWDVWGNLVSESNTPFGAVSFTYDSAGRRVSKTVGTTTTYYLYNGSTLLCEISSAGQVGRSYVWGPQGLIGDITVGSGSHYYLYDGLGNTRDVINPDQSLAGETEYTAWGSGLGGSVPTPFGWQGQYGAYTDAETGLIQMGARYYAPNLGRFISRDPSGFSAGANLFAFCGCDPVNSFDPTGCDYWQKGLCMLGAGILGFLGGGPIGAIGGVGAGGNLYDATVGAGTAQGQFDSHKISPLELAGSYANLGLATGATLAPALGGMGTAGDAEVLEEGQTATSEAEACSSGTCFVAGTPVQVAVGSKAKVGRNCGKGKGSVAPKEMSVKAIEALKAGDVVLSRNASTGDVEARQVLQCVVKHTPALVTISLADAKTGRVVDAVTATREHPFYVAGVGFVAAGRLAIGNAIVTRAGPSLIVKSLTWHRRAQGYTVYNFEVEGNHSYFVGNANGGVCVHNQAGCGDLTLPFEDGPTDLQARADALHGRLGRIAGEMQATAVLEAEAADGTLYTIAGSSVKGIFPKAQRSGLLLGEIAASGEGHAEVTAINSAIERGLTPKRIGVSGQPICKDCRALLTALGIEF